MNGESIKARRDRLVKQIALVVVGPLRLDDIELVQEIGSAAFASLGATKLVARAELPPGPICFVVVAS